MGGYLLHHPLDLVPLTILLKARYFDLAFLVFLGVVSSEGLLEVIHNKAIS